MKHFSKEEIVNRYADYRPQVQQNIIDTIATELGWKQQQFDTILDAACGTGHSTKPLLNYAKTVIGCDVSETMIQEAKLFLPEVKFHISSAETLPCEKHKIDVISIGFAYHWLNQVLFLKEAARALKPSGTLLIYNMRFTGNMLSNPNYTDWHKNTYQETYPNPKRMITPIQTSLEKAQCGLEIQKVLPLSYPLSFTKQSLKYYLTTQSNISAAVDSGESLKKIDNWLDAGLAPFFKKESEDFEYIGQAIILKAS